MARRITTLFVETKPYYIVGTSSGFVLEDDFYTRLSPKVFSEYSDAYDALEDFILEKGGQTI